MKSNLHACIVLVAVLSVVLIPVDTSAQCILDCPQGDGGVIVPAGPETHRTPDLDFNGVVDIQDFAIFGTTYCGVYDPCSDYNCDGLVDLIDLLLFNRHFLHAGPNPVACDP